MTRSQSARRSYGSGSIVVRRGAYYGKWRVGERQVMRKLGAVRRPGSREGLTRKQAEAELRKLMQEVRLAPAAYERLTVDEAGERYLRHVEHVLQRKPTTVADYGSILRRHLAPHFASQAIERITAEQVGAYMAAKSAEGLSVKTVNNHLNFAHGLFAFALKRGWVAANPVAAVDRPRPVGPNPDIRYLDRGEVEALLRAIPDDLLGQTDRALYLTATMTGLRQGELVALRWQDVDWVAGVVRVRRNYTRGRFGTPKTRRSSRAVPMADRVATELSTSSSARAIRQTRTSCSAIRRPAGPTTPRSSESVLRTRSQRRGCDRSAFTTCATPLALGWRRPARRCERSRSGWDTATSRRPRSMPTTRRIPRRARSGRRRRSERLPIWLPI